MKQVFRKREKVKRWIALKPSTIDRNTMFILVINQIDAQNLFYNKFISCLYMFRAPCAHHQEVKIVLYSLWYHHTIGGRPVHSLREDSSNLCTGRPPISVMISEAV